MDMGTVWTIRMAHPKGSGWNLYKSGTIAGVGITLQQALDYIQRFGKEDG